MGNYKFGSSDVNNVMIGTEQVDRIYMGTTLVWANETVVNLYSFVSDLQGWGGSVSWNSFGKVNGGSCRLNSSAAMSITTAPNDTKVRFWYYHQFSGAGAATSLNVTMGNGTVNIPIASDQWDQWIQVEANLTTPMFPPATVAISVVLSGDPGYTYIDEVEFVR